MKVTIKRNTYLKQETLGELKVFNDKGKNVYTCKTLELPDLNNLPQKSCIPPGTYTVVKRVSPKYGLHFHVTNVPNRSFILIHTGNYFSDILGCLLVGEMFGEINNDGVKDILNSKVAMKKLLKLLPNEFDLEILK